MNEALYNLIRAHYRDLQGYVSAGMESGKDEARTYMNANENPFELPGLEGFNRYPEPQPKALLEAYAQTYGVKSEQIFASRGSGESIALLVRLFCEPGEDAIAVNTPTFAMFGFNARAMPAKVIQVPLLKEDDAYALDVEGIVKAVLSSSSPRDPSASLNSGDPEKTASKAGRHMDPVRANSATPNANGMTGQVKLVFICNPNNPTGNAFPHEEIEEVCRALEGHAAVVLDEAYTEFSSAGSLADKLEDHPNLLILRTLSKAYGLAGVRMGATLCADPDFIAALQAKAADPYPVPTNCAEATIKALSQKDALQANIEKILSERDRLKAALEKSNLVRRIYPSETNFLLVEMEDARGFVQFCAENNVILRDFSDKPLTENCLRISAGTPEENDALLDLLKSFEK